MIGILSRPEQARIVEEFFQLLKTPWQQWDMGHAFEVIISTTGAVPPGRSALKIICGRGIIGQMNGVATRILKNGGVIRSVDGKRLPVYRELIVFPGVKQPMIFEDESSDPVGFVHASPDGAILWLGYDPFDELQEMLSNGQPPEFSRTMTLDEHFAWIREWITRSGVPFIEIPPVPAGYQIAVCLTHDIDHPGLRNHRFDHTMFGFLFRATLDACRRVWKGRRNLEFLIGNLKAAAKLPFVHLGLARDDWANFDEYLSIERGCGSTFFVIPNEGNPGRTVEGQAPAARACVYNLESIALTLKKIQSEGGEIAVHGLDAWVDSNAAERERERVGEAICTDKLGIRMHWLYFNAGSAALLDAAGFLYDSTCGYCDAIGYRAGTTQAFVPLGAAALMELPLGVMDTALFYPSYLDLDHADAKRLVWSILDDVERLGGILTINWHDRSIFPERQWDEFYLELLGELKARKAWMPTASAAVEWFSIRRSAQIKASSSENRTTVSVQLSVPYEGPGLRLRIHKPNGDGLTETGAFAPASFVDHSIVGDGAQTFAI
jgi:hypothetical protein